MGLLYAAVIGAIAGWLAGKLTSGKGFGILMNLVVGVVGGFIGSALFRVLGFTAHGVLAELIVATAGSVVLLTLVNAMAKRR